MPSCVIKTCKNQSTVNKKESGVTYHRFLKLGHENREAWIKIVRKNRNEETWMPSDYTCICSAHFKESDVYTTTTGRIYLRKTAMPGIDPSGSNSEDPLSEPKTPPNPEALVVDCLELKRLLRINSAAKKDLARKLISVQRQCVYFKKRCRSYKLIIQKLKAEIKSNKVKKVTKVTNEEAKDLISEFVKFEDNP